jgi:pimeloyl-ACP methyl ester carboxylesterase
MPAGGWEPRPPDPSSAQASSPEKLGSVWLLAGFVSLLEQEFACVLFDPPGTGSSEVPSDLKEWGAGAIAEDVVALVDELGFDRFALWGQSAGGCNH